MVCFLSYVESTFYVQFIHVMKVEGEILGKGGGQVEEG